MERKMTYQNRVIKYLAFFTILIILFGINGINIPLEKIEKYYFIWFIFILFSFVIIIYSLFNKIDIFEPITIVTIIYIMFFFVSPLVDLKINNLYFFDQYTFKESSKATVYFFVGYLFFIMGYTLSKNNGDKKFFLSNKKISLQSHLTLNIILWFFGFLSSIALMLAEGKSLLYMISFGFLGTVGNANDNNLEFLGMFSFAMIVPWLYLIMGTKSRILILVLTLATGSIFYLRGFRFIILIMIIAPMIFNYVKKGSRPKLITLVPLTAFIALLISVIGFARGNLREGTTVNWNSFNSNEIWYAISGNFEIYKTFYKMVEVIPRSFDYTLGSQMAYTFILFIPRIIWDGKPDTPLREVLESLLGEYSVRAGTAWPNVGEFYSEFGLIGIIFFMFVFGYLCKKSINLINLKNLNIHRLVAFSIFIPTLVQIVIRGYMPTNFWILVFFVIPIILNARFGYVDIQYGGKKQL